MHRKKSSYLNSATTHWPPSMVLSDAQLGEYETAALAAIDRMKELGVTKSTKADWRLVAAAQAFRRGEFSDELAAAAAMRKEIKLAVEVCPACRLGKSRSHTLSHQVPGVKINCRRVGASCSYC